MHCSTKPTLSTYTILLVATLCLAIAGSSTQAATGCPFEDTSCQEYCAEQGCNLGYCGHFAWIQCICRKCGDEWNSYDKVRLNPTKQVNQTELESLKLNGTGAELSRNLTASQLLQQILPSLTTEPSQNSEGEPVETVVDNGKSSQGNTVTLLLVPDLSTDNDNLDQNEIPDENSEKFLDYLVDNHAKLVQATLARASQSTPTEDGDQPDDDLIEIQLSSNNKNSSKSITPDELHKTTTNSPLQNLLRPESTTTTTTTTPKTTPERAH